jgi:predicted RNA-binding protein
MCESAVYLVKGSERTLVMPEVARLVVHDRGITCIDTLGDRKEVPGARISEANLVKHEIVLRPVQS